MGGTASECDVCGHRATGRRGGTWDRPTPFVVIMLLTLGPFALPWVWFHPRYSTGAKWLVSTFVIVGTLALCGLLGVVIWLLIKQLRELFSGLYAMAL